MTDLQSCKSFDNLPSDVIFIVDQYSTFQLSQESNHRLLWETIIDNGNSSDDDDDDYNDFNEYCERWALHNRDIFVTTDLDTVRVFIDQKFYSKFQKENILFVCIGRSDKFTQSSTSAYYIIVLHEPAHLFVRIISIFDIDGQCVSEFQISAPLTNVSICGIFASGGEIIVRKHRSNGKVILEVYTWFGVKLRSFEILNDFRTFVNLGKICFDVSADGTGIGFIYTSTRVNANCEETKTYLCQYDRRGTFLNKMLIDDPIQICPVPNRSGQILSAGYSPDENGLVNINLYDFNVQRRMKTLISQNRGGIYRMTVGCNGTIMLLGFYSIRCFGRKDG